MKTEKIFIGLIMTLGLLTSCDRDNIRASDEVTSLDYSIPDYSTLKISNAFDAYVTFLNTEESIRIEANENLHNKIIVEREGNSLIIRLKKFTNIRGNATLNVYIATKNLTKFDISGASSLTLENEWNTQNANIELSGASNFSGEVTADHLYVDMHGASNIDVYGSANILSAELAGSSELKDYDLFVKRLNIEMSGASEALLSVSESIDVEASGASELNYKGDATLAHKKLSGNSEIKNRN